ncbi:MAG: molybdopterin-dependent oxidoreductase [Planctomycetaceae bacterium]
MPRTSDPIRQFLAEHAVLSRRWFLRTGAAGAVAMGAWPVAAAGSDRSPVLEEAIAKLEPYLTPQDKFEDVSRGKPKPHSLPDETKAQVGMTRDTWKLEIIGDPEHPPKLRQPLTKEKGTAFDFQALMQLAETHAVRFPKLMTCLNLACPLGTGIWEGVPLREVLWLTQPSEDLRRVFYYGYHNDDPAQMFRSSLPVGRILEDPFDLPPVILCYKLNGDWLTSERGGPVRIVVPEAYGFKSIKWLSHVVLSNIAHANDTYAEQNNDVDSPLKSFAATLSVPNPVKPDTPFAVTGYAQVGISGVSKVQVWLQRDGEELPDTGRYFEHAPWQDAEILGPPSDWGGGLPDGRIPSGTRGFKPDTNEPQKWPLRLTKVHWAFLCPGLPAGEYTLRTRTVDDNGYGQPLPRPFKKSGRVAIEQVPLQVTG